MSITASSFMNVASAQGLQDVSCARPQLLRGLEEHERRAQLAPREALVADDHRGRGEGGEVVEVAQDDRVRVEHEHALEAERGRQR